MVISFKGVKPLAIRLAVSDCLCISDCQCIFFLQRTGAQIKVYSQCCPESTERVVAIGGKPKIVVDCIETIHDLLQTVSPILLDCAVAEQ